MSATCASSHCCCTGVIFSLPVILLAMVHCPCTDISCTATGFSSICSRDGGLWASVEDMDIEQLATAHCTARQQSGGQVLVTAKADRTTVAASGRNTAELRTVVKSALRGCRASAFTRHDNLCYFYILSFHPYFSPW